MMRPRTMLLLLLVASVVHGDFSIAVASLDQSRLNSCKSLSQSAYQALNSDYKVPTEIYTLSIFDPATSQSPS